MIGAVAPYPKLQFFDPNGTPYAFGKVFTYAAGTSTPLVTYTDATLTVANTNPVILDAAGRADIWIGAPLYKFVLQDTFGAVIWTEDNLQSTAASQSFQLTATGTVIRTLNSKLADWYGPKDFGALGNGSTDDSAAFIAYNNAYPNGGGYLPAGTYVIKSNVTLSGPITIAPQAIVAPFTGFTFTMSNAINAGDYQIFSNANGGSVSLINQATFCKSAWFGMSVQNTATANTSAFNFLMASVPVTSGCHVIWPSGQININNCSHSNSGVIHEGHYAGTWLINNSANTFALEALGTGNFYNTFKNFRIGQASGVTAVAGNGAIHVQSQETKIIDCECYNFPGSMYDGIFVDGVLAGWIERTSCINMINDGMHFGGGCGDIFLNSVYSSGNGQMGYYFNGSSGIYANIANGYANGVSAFYFDSTGHVNGSGTINEFFFGQSCIADTSGNINWNILNLADSTFNSCWGSTQSSNTVNIFAVGFNISGSGCKNITFNGCLALSNNYCGFVIDQGATNVELTGCITRNGGKGGNAGSSGFFIGLGAAVTNVTMTSCRAFGYPNYGTSLGAFASDYIIISSCNNQGNTTGTLQNNATGTHNQIGTGANV